jgi:hypothetical protein
MEAEEHERRIAANEALFRSANNRIEDLNRAFETVTDAATWICECADPACVERIQLPLEEYREVRSHPARFMVVPGHELVDFERVVDDRAGYLVVEKRAGVGRAAARMADRDEREGRR